MSYPRFIALSAATITMTLSTCSKDGAEPVGTPEELAAFMKRDVQKYAKAILAVNVQVE